MEQDIAERDAVALRIGGAGGFGGRPERRWRVEQCGGRAGERHVCRCDGLAVGAPGQRVQRRGRHEVAGGVVERLGG
jgi:hypothetical protein